MIQKEFTKGNRVYHLICDICDETLATYDTFTEAVEGKKDYVKSQKINGEWVDFCANCRETIEALNKPPEYPANL